MRGFGSMLRDYLEYYKISQSDFAERLEISKKHLSNIINGKVGISDELMIAISLITDIDLKLIVFTERKRLIAEYMDCNFPTEKEQKNFLNTFSIKEMDKRNWFRLKDITSPIQNAMDLLNFIKLPSFNNLNTYMDRRVLYKKSDDANKLKIFLWTIRCDNLAIEQEVGEYSSKRLNDLLEELKIERNKEFNEKRLVKLFNKYGIYLVVEDALKGTKVRGCMVVKKTNPAIYLTKYYKEKSSFYFALYHELAHVKTDYNKAKSKIIVSVDEKETDDTALNWMIDAKVWREIIKNRDKVKELCKEHKIPLCFAYSRMAKEGLISYRSIEYNSSREKIN